MLKVLITGITGFAGGHLASYLAAKGGVEIHGAAIDQGYGFDFLDYPISLIIGDLQDSETVSNMLLEARPDHIYHLAAQAYVPTSWEDPWQTFENNVRPELNILETMVRRQMDSRLLVVASNEIYGTVPSEQLPVRETAALRPNNPYGVSKVAQDLLGFQYFLSHQVDVIRVRSFNHLGPRQSPQFVAASFARQIAEAEAGMRDPVLYVGNLEAQRDFTDVTDVVRAYALLMQKGQAGVAYNVGSGKARSVQRLLDTLLSMSKVPIRVKPDPARARPADAPMVVADNTRLKTATGWSPTVSFQESLRRVLEYWRAVVRRDGYQPEIPQSTAPESVAQD